MGMLLYYSNYFNLLNLSSTFKYKVFRIIFLENKGFLYKFWHFPLKINLMKTW